MFATLLFQDPQSQGQLAGLKAQGSDAYGQMPPAASTFAADVDGLFYFCWIISIIFFFLIAGLLLYTSVVHRRKTEDQAAVSDVTHNTPLEVVWTLIPTIILMVIFAWGWKGNLEQSLAPSNALQYTAVAQKWSWAFGHPGKSQLRTGEVWVPVNTPVRFTMRSEDVLHSLYVPAFRAKRDVLPGRYQTVWFEATEVGDYPLFCTEYCGTDHSRMVAVVHVVSQEEWAKDPAALEEVATEDYGKSVYQTNCIACHSIDGSARIGPSFKGLWGRTETLTDGKPQLVDEDYIIESIRKPQEKIVQGYEPEKVGLMTAYNEQLLSDTAIQALIEFLKSDELKD